METIQKEKLRRVDGDRIAFEYHGFTTYIPMWQDAVDATGRVVGRVPNLIGVVAGEEIGICHLADRTYKDKEPDICDFVFKIDCTREELKDKCDELGIGFYEYPLCSKCGDVMYGSFTVGEKGYECNKHE